jgi:hypothetical protein
MPLPPAPKVPFPSPADDEEVDEVLLAGSPRMVVCIAAAAVVAVAILAWYLWS